MKRQQSQSSSFIPVVSYLRMSSMQQDTSVPEQRKQIARMAAERGYLIIREYLDEGISGDATEKRVQFQQMIRDASERKDFECILCWDSSRFGRFDSLEAGFWIHPLIQAGVTRLVTVADGVIDWSNESDRALFGIKQDFGNRRYLVDLSRNTMRGKLASANQGFTCGGPAPYGYDRMLIDADGNPQQRVVDGEKFAKPKSWRTTFVISENEEKVEIVREIFRRFGNTEIGMRHLATELNDRGIAAPRGGKWHVKTVRQMLTNPIYCGDMVWGKTRGGKYHSFVEGSKVVARSEAKSLRPKEVDQVVVRDAVPALVERATWERIQKKLERRQVSNIRPRREVSFVLAGLVYCGHCGAKMTGTTTSANGHCYRYFRCRSYQQYGSNTCGSNSVNEAALLDIVTDSITNVIGPTEIKLIEAEIENQLRGDMSRADSGESTRLQRKARELERKISKGAENLLLADKELIPTLQAQLRQWQTQLEATREKLALHDQTENRSSVDPGKLAKQAIGELHRLREHLESQDPLLVRNALAETVNRVDLFFTHRQAGKKKRSMLDRGVVQLIESDASEFLSRAPNVVT